MKFVSRKTQLAHMNEPEVLKKFKADYERTPEVYWEEYEVEFTRDNDGQPDALYICVCSDLGIKPKKPDMQWIRRKVK